MKLILLITGLLAGLQSLAAKIIVDAAAGTLSLREAVAAAHNGDTILVKKGIYYLNNVVITKTLTIIGENYPVLNGAEKYEIMTISGTGTAVKGFYFKNSGYSSMNDYAALKIIDARNFTIENNYFTGTYFGIHVANSQNFAIRGNILQGQTKSEQTTGNGIHLWKCSNALIENNSSSGHRDGIYFEFVTHSTIRGNSSFKNLRYGLHFMFSNDDVYSHNVFRENGAGVAVMFSKSVTMLNNTFENNWGPSSYGILLKEISNSKIEHNNFLQNTVGIHLEGSNRIELSYNLFKQNGWAAKVQASCSENNFYHNNFIANTFDIATNGTLVLNSFSENYWDKYEGYDLNKDGMGDVAYHPVSMYSMIIEQNPNSLMLLHSLIVTLLDKAEKAIPALTPVNLKDDKPLMKRIKI